ncbi:hypothetical protein EG361_01255 [Listeria monocytogenes]|nr:hypothetical protein [Listeria monocytogenes]
MIKAELGVFLYNDILIGEYKSNLNKAINSTKEKFKRFLGDKDTLNELIPMFGVKRKKEKIEKFEKAHLIPFENKFWEYIKLINGIDTKIKDISIEEIFKKYFDAKPPFQTNENKKSEFPDAFIFESVIDWVKNDPKFIKGRDSVYFVTRDKGISKAFSDTLVNVVTDLSHCLVSSVGEEIKEKININIASDEFLDFLQDMLYQKIEDYLLIGDLDIDGEPIYAEAREYNIEDLGDTIYKLIAVNEEWEKLKIIIEVSSMNLSLDVRYMESISGTGYYDRETGRVFGEQEEEKFYDIETEVKLVLEFSIDKESLFAKRLKYTEEDIENETDPVLKKDLQNYAYGIKDIDDAVYIEIDGVKKYIKDSQSSKWDGEVEFI